MKEPAGNWFRVSSSGQDEESQIPQTLAWNESHGYEVDPRNVYTLHGKSAFKGSKKFDKTWAKVLADIRSGAIRVLVVWKSDRLDRKLHMLRMIEEVVNAGGRVEFVTEAHLNDLSTMAGRISLKIAEEIAHQESQAKSDRVKIKHEALKAAGSLTSRPPWGLAVYAADGIKTLISTEVGRQLVPQIFERCAIGNSLAQIALWLKNETGRGWYPRTIGTMIRCATYMGRQQDAAGRTILRCEALVTAELWQRANASLSARPGPGKGGRPVAIEKALLASVLGCPLCDGPMYRVAMGGYSPVRITNLLTGRRERRFNVVRGKGADWVRTGGQDFYYRCAGKEAVRRSACRNMVPVAVTDALVTRFMATLRKPIVRTEYIPGHDHRAELAEIEQDMAALRRSDPDYRLKYAALDAEYERVSELPKVLPEIRPVDTDETYASRWAALGAAERGEWLRSSGVRVYASKTGGPQGGPRALGEGTVARADAIEGNGVRVVIRWNLEALRAA